MTNSIQKPFHPILLRRYGIAMVMFTDKNYENTNVKSFYSTTFYVWLDFFFQAIKLQLRIFVVVKYMHHGDGLFEYRTREASFGAQCTNHSANSMSLCLSNTHCYGKKACVWYCTMLTNID